MKIFNDQTYTRISSLLYADDELTSLGLSVVKFLAISSFAAVSRIVCSLFKVSG